METLTGFECDCLDRFYGDRCESYNPCSTKPCLNQATCLPLTNETFSCVCTHHAIGGNNCQLYDFCSEMDPCRNDGNCTLINAEPTILDWNVLRTVSVLLDGAAATLQVKVYSPTVVNIFYLASCKVFSSFLGYSFWDQMLLFIMC